MRFLTYADARTRQYVIEAITPTPRRADLGQTGNPDLVGDRLAPRRVKYIKRSFNTACDVATAWEIARAARASADPSSMAARAGMEPRFDLSDVTPHVLRHTSITLRLQCGAPIREVAGYHGVTVDLIERVYGHHHPEYQEAAVAAMD